MRKNTMGFSVVGLLIVLAIIAFLSYQYFQSSQSQNTQQAPKTQKQLDQFKKNLNQQVQNSQRDKALEDL
ncbi:MAG TPA: hypothetical protein PKC21_05700 [Oligoflexia bacterium]|nr:hypothetical protein [Oligoflexia bacterium]HMR24829.1 hypothetical protein [Oligoflexia bacterium]